MSLNANAPVFVPMTELYKKLKRYTMTYKELQSKVVFNTPPFYTEADLVAIVNDGCFNPVVLALDCEMCRTKNGSECTRVTVVDEDCRVIYESLVLPADPIIDYVTRFSGITAELLARGPTKALGQVQKDLLCLIKEDTILVGHSIECDLRALKLKHNALVDTSLLFMGKRGKRVSLRQLTLTHLGRKIQETEDGHNSKEDGQACMELLRFKIKNDEAEERVKKERNSEVLEEPRGQSSTPRENRYFSAQPPCRSIYFVQAPVLQAPIATPVQLQNLQTLTYPHEFMNTFPAILASLDAIFRNNF